MKAVGGNEKLGRGSNGGLGILKVKRGGKKEGDGTHVGMGSVRDA